MKYHQFLKMAYYPYTKVQFLVLILSLINILQITNAFDLSPKVFLIFRNGLLEIQLYSKFIVNLTMMILKFIYLHQVINFISHLVWISLEILFFIVESYGVKSIIILLPLKIERPIATFISFSRISIVHIWWRMLVFSSLVVLILHLMTSDFSILGWKKKNSKGCITFLCWLHKNIFIHKKLFIVHLCVHNPLLSLSEAIQFMR